MARRAPTVASFCLRLAALMLPGLLAAREAGAQQLAADIYDARQGLSHNETSDVFQDSSGYLWITTWEGLSRFDGRRFERFGVEHGLPARVLNAVTEDAHGTIWVGTNGRGIARLTRGSARQFVVTSLGYDDRADFVNNLVFDRSGRPWCLTDAGLFAGEPKPGSNGDWVFTHVVDYRGLPRFMPALRDAHDRLWFGVGSTLAFVDQLSGMTPQSYPAPDGRPIVGLATDDKAALVVTDRGAFLFQGGASSSWTTLPWRPPAGAAFYAAARAYGAWWLGGEGFLMEVRGGRPQIWRLGSNRRPTVVAISPDREGNLWLATSQGAYRVPPHRIAQYLPADGLPESPIARLLHAPDGRVFASTTDAGLLELTPAGPRTVPGTTRPPLSTVADRIVVTKRGEWFAAASGGIFRLVPGRQGEEPWRMSPLPAARVDAQFMLLDQADRLWVRLNTGGNTRFHITDGRLVPAPVPDESQVARVTFITLTQTPGSDIWLGGMTTLDRLQHGRMEALGTSHGLPEATPRAMLVDRRGRLWMGLRYSGLAVTSDPDAPAPRFDVLTPANGLSSNTVSCLTEGGDGRIYAGTGRGLDRLDPETRHVEAIGPAIAIAGSWVRSCLTDTNGRVWASTERGIVRIDVEGARFAISAPPVFITRVELGGVSVALPATADTAPARIEVPARTSSVRFEFSSPVLRPETRVRHEYRLEGVDVEWRPAGDERTLTYGRLPPGPYRFNVRALLPASNLEPTVATVSLMVLAPVWMRPWFIGLAAGLGILVALTLHRARVRRLLALERVRKQVALDLHDDLGSGLAQIAILTEVASRNAERRSSILGEVTRLCRSLRESMTDIVWAVDPRFDSLADVVTRIRETAFRLLDPQHVRLRFDAPPVAALERIHLDAPVRRHLLLLAKEAVTNAARHAAAASVSMSLTVDRDVLRLTVEDDGRGFDASPDVARNGLHSLRDRVTELGGTLEVQSSASGTRITLVVPRKSRLLPSIGTASR